MALGAEKVTNGGFPSATTGWTAASSGVLASVSGGQSGNCLRVTNGAAAFGYGYQTLAVVSGSSYMISAYFKKGTLSNGRFYVGTSIGGNQVWNSGILTDTTWTEHTKIFTATTTAVYFSCLNGESTDTGTSYFDEVSLKLIGSFARDGMFMGMSTEM